jgi:hypothetical protein
VRSDLLKEFANHKRSLITNARCLTEGVDVPAIDCVLFADPKQSRIDIVQAAGRALRRYPGKEYGYILLPLIVPRKMEFSKFAETTAFRQVASTITALSIQDERIAEEFRAIEKGRVSSGKIVEIEGDVPVGMKIKLGDFAEAISTRLWENVGRANWRPFDDARTFVRSLGCKNHLDWVAYCQSGERPSDIPAAPSVSYPKEWSSWGDWLGTGFVHHSLREHLPFKEARVFAHNLGLKSGAEWREYSKSSKRPDDIPANPESVYAKSGWSGMGDWLVKYGSEWREYLRSGRKPEDIPANPEAAYANDGWSGMGDWLGTGRIADRLREYRPFKKARAYVHRLGLKSQAEWFKYSRSGKKPDDIPQGPNRTYENAGWTTYGDWLGTGTVATRLRKYRSFKKARAFVRSLSLKSAAEWLDYCKSGKKPDDIPIKPYKTYADSGWAGLGDWLGTGTVASHLRKYRSFKEARAFVRGLGLQSQSQWRDYSKSGKKPADIPSNPGRKYAKTGWAGYADWLG